MRKEMAVNGVFLNVPVWTNGEEDKLEIFLKTSETYEKVFEAVVLAGDRPCDFYAPIPTEALVKKYEETDEESAAAPAMIRAEAGAALLERLFFSDEPETGRPAGPGTGGPAEAEVISQYGREMCEQDETEKISRPVIHFTPRTGWGNDPNGLIYDKGIYHMYFQCNPFDIRWGNLSWGHAVSTDLLHWTQENTVMFPDADGFIYSGCAIRNSRACLNLPDDALLFFYTSAGGMSDWSSDKGFTQKTAYSLDGGRTLTKLPEPCVPVIYNDSRDPKVYRHEESSAYIMVLWLRGNEFGILRSENFKQWQLTDSFTLEGGWECPDLLKLRDEEGNYHWFFWSADGYYYPGEFDGWHFKQTGARKCAYLTGLPYAAQTYSGVDDRVISVPWLRLPNDGRPWTGAYGIPVELSCRTGADGPEIVQKPVRELKAAGRDITESLSADPGGYFVYQQQNVKKALLFRVRPVPGQEIMSWFINESLVEYEPSHGIFRVDDDFYRVDPDVGELLFLVDDSILEVFFDAESRTGAFMLNSSEVSLRQRLSADAVEYLEIYEID